MSAVKQKTNKDPLDRYYTPAWVTQLLVEDWPFQVPIWNVWEPCCGNGDMTKILSDNSDFEYGEGLTVWSSDIDEITADDFTSFKFDFLRDELNRKFECVQQTSLFEAMHRGTLAIVTNPPYSIPGATAADFVRKALEYTPYVAMLLRLSWADGCAERSDIFSERPPAEIRVIRPRIHFTGPNESETKAPNGASAWFIWRPGSEGTVMSWIGGEVQS